MKNIQYNIIPVHLVKDGGQQFKEEFSKINPIQRVPVLEFENNSQIMQRASLLR